MSGIQVTAIAAKLVEHDAQLEEAVSLLELLVDAARNATARLEALEAEVERLKAGRDHTLSEGYDLGYHQGLGDR